MGYYAHASSISLQLRDDADKDAAQAVIEAWDDGWELVDLTDTIDLAFSAKYRGVEQDLIQLAPFVKPGEYAQFVGEDDAVWRLVFTEHGTLEAKTATF